MQPMRIKITFYHDTKYIKPVYSAMTPDQYREYINNVLFAGGHMGYMYRIQEMDSAGLM